MLKVATVLPHEPYREYKDVERVYSGSTEIDKILDKNGNVLFAVNKEVEGTPALTYKGKKETNLKNYRIYGNTVNGESVGDRTANLWDETIIQGGTQITGTILDGNPKRLRSDYIFVEPGETYSFASNLKIRIIYSYDDNNQKVSLIRDAPNGDISYTFTVPNAATKIIIIVMKRINNVEYDITPDDFEWGQLEKGSVVTSYEPYGYRVPVTVTNGADTQTTNLYLPEPIKMVGDEAEYIDYAERKLHRVRKNLVQTIATSQTINDITFTVNANGSVTCNGTNHGNNPIIFELNNPDVVFPEGVYITSGCPAGGSITGGYKIQYFNGSSWNYELGSGSTFTLSGNLKYRSRILISKDVTVTNLTFYPMLRLASIEDDTYEPYIEDTELDVTLPALPTLSGTNTLTVGTEVQPSNVYLKGRIKEIT